MMWSGFLTLALASACGLYAIGQHHDDVATSQDGMQARIAASMAIYRDAVVRYAHANPGFQGQVKEKDLALPDWYTPVKAGLWSNHVGADGLIAVYATSLPILDIGPALQALAQGSALAGRANPKAKRLEPAAGGDPIDLPAIPGVTLAEGAPVWLAHRD